MQLCRGLLDLVVLCAPSLTTSCSQCPAGYCFPQQSPPAHSSSVRTSPAQRTPYILSPQGNASWCQCTQLELKAHIWAAMSLRQEGTGKFTLLSLHASWWASTALHIRVSTSGSVCPCARLGKPIQSHPNWELKCQRSPLPSAAWVELHHTAVKHTRLHSPSLKR